MSAVPRWLRRADDPGFWVRAGQACRLCLHPPPGTVLIGLDEKTAMQARSSTHPGIPSSRAATFISFLSLLDQSIPPGLEIRLIMDNGSSRASRAA